MACKYPIILVHGLMIRHSRCHRAFGNIAPVLEDAGNVVYVSTHDGFGSIETNAEQIKSFVLTVLSKTNAQKVNIIAHSKGGLDVKCALSDPDFSTRVASFTTLSTPHKGSALASFIWRFPTFIKKPLAFFINAFYKMLGDKHPDAIKACYQLREEIACDNFSLPQGIYAQSYSGKMKRASDCFVMCIPNTVYKILKKAENDGMVTPESATFADYKGDFSKESLSHAQIVDFMTPAKKKEKVFAFYKKLVLDLEEKGF
ncbi:MAG: hypothetical protein IKB38_03390 [Clostridia bacterium]|nr:hypothetical protein [Clostridia bacterium]